MWVGLVFNLAVSLLFAGFLLRAVRRYERRADAVLEEMDRTHEAELRKFDSAREAARISLLPVSDEGRSQIPTHAAASASEPVLV